MYRGDSPLFVLPRTHHACELRRSSLSSVASTVPSPRIRPPRARARISWRRLARGRVAHAFLLPFVVLATAAMVSLAILPPILAIGRAAQRTDAKLLGSTNRNLVLPSLPER